MGRRLEEYTHEELIEYIKTLKKQKRFGLVWEDKPENVVKECETKLPVVKEIEEKAIENAPGEPTNIIIEGDNYHALSVLNYTHAEKIDVIYIDPPYNTGSKDFVYNDCYVDAEDTFRHSKWLSFMDRRLRLAKNLLADDGIVFISIDDNEYAQLKILCDEIFGEENFVANIINQSANSVYGTKASAKNRTYIKIKDYVLVYKKYGAQLNLNPLYSPSKSYLHDSHDFVYECGVKVSTTDWFKDNYGDVFRKYGLNINKGNIQKVLEFDEEIRDEVIERLLDIQYRTVGAYNEKLLSESELNRLANGEIVEHDGQLLYSENDGKSSIGTLRPLRDSCHDVAGKLVKCEILGDIWNTSSAYQNINAEGGVRFKNGKKPVLLIENILQSINKPNAIVLDFFAGSGTTGHAVLEQNLIDGGRRSFILCTNNEDGIAEDTMYVRMENISKGIGANKAFDYNLRYFKTDFVEKGKTTDDTREALITECSDMIRIRENAFEHVASAPEYRFYKNDKVFVPIIFDQFAIAETWELVEKLNTEKSPVHCYNFSYNRHANEEEIPEDTELTWTACSIPETMLEVYRKIFRKKEI